MILLIGTSSWSLDMFPKKLLVRRFAPEPGDGSCLVGGNVEGEVGSGGRCRRCCRRCRRCRCRCRVVSHELCGRRLCGRCVVGDVRAVFNSEIKSFEQVFSKMELISVTKSQKIHALE